MCVVLFKVVVQEDSHWLRIERVAESHACLPDDTSSWMDEAIAALRPRG